VRFVEEGTFADFVEWSASGCCSLCGKGGSGVGSSGNRKRFDTGLGEAVAGAVCTGEIGTLVFALAPIRYGCKPKRWEMKAKRKGK